MKVHAQDMTQMERFRNERISFFNEKLGLTEEEATLFWPIQEDLHNRMMKINEDEKNLLNYYSSNFEAMSEEEIDQTIKKFMDLQQSRMDLTNRYHEKFVETIGKKKTMRLYSLDREFKMHVLRRYRAGDPPGQGRNRGPRCP